MKQPLHIKTPLLESLPLSRCTGSQAWVKMESMQPSGSFKTRGVGFACQEYAARGCKRFVSSSGGNAGLAVAFAGRRLGLPVTVVVPESTTERAKELIRQEGAEVVVHGASWQEAHAEALALTDEHTTCIHPFDDPLIWQGHASLVDEIAEAGLKPDLVVLSVGGGGLFCGVVEGLQRNGWHDVAVLACETTGADSFHRAFKARTLVELDRIDTVATSLGAKKIAPRALELALSHPVLSATFSDHSAVMACLNLARDHRVVVEPACGAALAAGYENIDALRAFKRIVFIVCGGVGVDYDTLKAYAAR